MNMQSNQRIFAVINIALGADGFISVGRTARCAGSTPVSTTSLTYHQDARVSSQHPFSTESVGHGHLVARNMHGCTDVHEILLSLCQKLKLYR